LVTRAGLGDAVDVLALHQPLQHIGHGLFRQRHHRVAARQLVAAVHQRVQRQRIIIRRQRFFFGQHGQHADFKRVQYFCAFFHEVPYSTSLLSWTEFNLSHSATL
jgi:hypothetical protein